MTGPRAPLAGQWAHQLFRGLARWRGAPAFHPHGAVFRGALEVPGRRGRWGVPLLDRAGRYDALVRWSRAAGLPGALPDGLGLAVRVLRPPGSEGPLDLLLTSCGTVRPLLHTPLARRDALGGPYSTLLSYRVGGGALDRARVIAAFPADEAGRHLSATPPALREALALAPVRLALGAAASGEPWHLLGHLLVGPPAGAPPPGLAFDPYAHHLPGLHPTGRLHTLREAAYAGSRTGRDAGPP